MDATIEEADVTDVASWRAYADVWNEVVQEVGGPTANQVDGPAIHRHQRHSRLWLARAGADVVGVSRLIVIPERTPRIGFGGAHVLPIARGRGLGTQLVEALELAATELGATRLEGVVYRGEGNHAAAAAAEALATSRGYRKFRTDILRELALPTHVNAPAPPGYNIEVRRDAAGIEAELADLLTLMSELIPTGDVERSVRRVTADDVARWYGPDADESFWIGIARGASGQAAGFVTMTANPDSPSQSERVLLHQGDTLVLPEHRGHGLGLAMKGAVLTAAQADVPTLRRQHTSNAEANTHMIAINERLGYRVYGSVTNWVKPLG